MIYSKYFVLIIMFVVCSNSTSAQNSAIYKSTFIFNFNVDTAFVQFGQVNPAIQKVANGDTLTVSNGFYHIYLSIPTDDDKYVAINALKDSVYTISHNFDLSSKEIDVKTNNISLKHLIGGDVIIVTDFDTQIYRNSEYLSDEFAIFTLKERSTEYTIKNDRFYDRTNRITKSNRIQIVNASFYENKGNFKLYDTLPGFLYRKEKRYGKMAIVLGGLAVSTGLFVHYQKSYSNKSESYQTLRNIYLDEQNEFQAAQFGERMEAEARKLESTNLKRNLALGGMITFITIDIIDKFRISNRINNPVNNKLDLFLAPKFRDYISVGANLKF